MKLKIKYQLIIYFMVVITVIFLAAVVYVLQRNKDYSINTLYQELISYNKEIYRSYKSGIDFSYMDLPPDIRLTIIDTNAWVIYDNCEFESIIGDNHASREEIIKASNTGEGTALRLSATMHEEYLYYAKKYPEFFIRTASPYKNEDIKLISEDRTYLYFISALFALLVLSLIYISKKLTKPLKAFNEFFDILKSDNKDFSNLKFPNNEYGEVGLKIVDAFNQVEKTKLYKQQMSHNIAHELKTPVTGIRAYLETILHDDSMNIEQMKKFADKAYAQTIRLTNLINDVSTLNKLDEQSQQYIIEEVNIASCIKEVEEELGYKLRSNNISFQPLISSDLSFRGCYQLVYSLFKNLIDNTIEHGGPNTTITINAGISQKSGDESFRISFTYSDTGKSVPEESLERLFERFYRIEKGRTRRNGGSGLGLAIVKNAVLFHKGTITAENRPGGGLTFKFNLMSL